MFYQFMKWYLGWMVKLYFRRVYSKGTELVPDGEPAIFASNHPAGFVEPIILTTNLRQDIHFLVLGSFLTKKWLKWFFNGVKMVPIYRRDIAGDQSIEKNQSTFQYVYDSLEKNSHILIYPEAKTHFIYKLRPLKKGIARMSRGFLKKGTHDKMYIVPAGVNFIHVTRFRSDVFFNVGEPIKLDDWNGDEAKWLKSTINKTSEGMSKVMFNVADESRHASVQDMVEIKHYELQNKADVMVPAFVKAPDHVESIMEVVRKLDEKDPKAFSDLQEKLTDYIEKRKRRKLHERVMGRRGKFSLWHVLLLIIGLPLAIVGFALNAFSLLSSWWVKAKLVKRVEYKAGVASAISTVLTLVFFIVLLILGLIIHYYLLILAILLPVSLYFLIYYLDLGSLFLQSIRYRLTPKSERVDLLKIRDELLR